MLPVLSVIFGTVAATLLNDIVQQLRMANCRNSDVKIIIPIEEIENLNKCHTPLLCQESVGTMRGEFYVAGGDWSRLKLSDKENRAREFNLIDHLSQLLAVPSVENKTFLNSATPKRMIPLVTYQNGINNTPKDFKNKCELIIQNLPERPLSIGVFNPSNGKALPLEFMAAIPDLYRMQEEKVYNTDTLTIAWRFFATLAKVLPQDQNFFWVHVAHSEGTLLANLALTNPLLSSEQQNFFKNHLHVLTYGAVMPVPKLLVYKAINTYSIKDITWKNYGKQLMSNKMDYEIVCVLSIENSFSAIAGDHDFLGNTYKKALRDNLNDIRKEYTFL